MLTSSLIWNPYWLIVLANSSDNDYEHVAVDQYDPYAIPFEKMPY